MRDRQGRAAGTHLESTQVDTLVLTELAVRHVSVVPDDLSQVLGREGLLARVDNATLARIPIPLRLEGLPLASLGGELLLRQGGRFLRVIRVST